MSSPVDVVMEAEAPTLQNIEAATPTLQNHEQVSHALQITRAKTTDMEMEIDGIAREIGGLHISTRAQGALTTWRRTGALDRRRMQLRPNFSPASGLLRVPQRTVPRPSNDRINKVKSEARRSTEERLRVITRNILRLNLKPATLQRTLLVVQEFFVGEIVALEYNLPRSPLKALPMIREQEEEASSSTATSHMNQDTRVVVARPGELEEGLLERIRGLSLSAPQTSDPVADSRDLVGTGTVEGATANTDAGVGVQPELPI